MSGAGRVEVPGPLVVWSPDRTRPRCLVLEERDRDFDERGRGDARGRLWVFERGAAGGWLGRALAPQATWNDVGYRAYPPRQVPCWLGDGSGIAFETWEAPDAGHTVHVASAEPGTGAVRPVAASSRDRAVALAGAVPRSRAVALRFAPSDALERAPGHQASRAHGLALVDEAGDAPRVLVERGLHFAVFAPTGEHVAILLHDDDHAFRLHLEPLGATAPLARTRGYPVGDVGLVAWSPSAPRVALGFLEVDERGVPRQGYLVAERAAFDGRLVVERQLDARRDLQLVAWLPHGDRHVRSSTDRAASLEKLFGTTPFGKLEAELDAAPDAGSARAEPTPLVVRWFLRGMSALVRRAVRAETARLRDALVADVVASDPQTARPTAIEVVGGLEGTRVLAELGESDAVSWLEASPDGRWVGAVVVRDDGRSEFVAVALASGEERATPEVVASLAPEAGPPAWIGRAATLAWVTHGDDGSWWLETWGDPLDGAGSP